MVLCRNPRFPLYFSAASLLCGCVIFAGALRVHDDMCDLLLMRRR